MTKSEAAQLILGTQDMPLRLELKRNLARFEAYMKGHLGSGDDFFVRATFNLLSTPPENCESLATKQALSVSIGDIFHVTDTLLAGSFAAWLVSVIIF